ncbi:MAG: esterase, partial [Bacteroidetes bacterium]|nr:esterase [Bacteroidota bacterium]
MPEHKISYSTQKTYSTLNQLTDKTENIWFVCHGLGYLSRYFIEYFSVLDSDKNYIIAPQAPSKYYQDKNFKHIGASWLTREETQLEMENIKAYFDAIYEKEIQSYPDKKLIVLGYSQGVSVAMRWIAQSKINCDKLLIHSGGIPEELETKDFEGLKFKPYLIYGKSDPYITKERAQLETQKVE